ncbi:MAG: hypothetical protein AAGC44_02090 [Planctomycetota bacterium]
MIQFNNQNLFNSGPATTEPGPIQARQHVGETPGSIGGPLIHQGLAHREIHQQGQLIADTPGQLHTLTQAISAYLDGREATLTDEHGRDWPSCVLHRFEPGEVTRLGPRYTIDYRLTYFQLRP